MRRSTREDIHTEQDRRAERADREKNHDKWTGMLETAMQRCGFRLEPENKGMMKIVNPDDGEVLAHAPLHISSKRKLGSIIEGCERRAGFTMH